MRGRPRLFLMLALCLTWGGASLTAQPRLPFAEPEPLNEGETFSFPRLRGHPGKLPRGGHDALVRQMELEPEVRLILSSGDVVPGPRGELRPSFLSRDPGARGEDSFLRRARKPRRRLREPRREPSRIQGLSSGRSSTTSPTKAATAHLAGAAQPCERGTTSSTGARCSSSWTRNLFIDEGKYRRAHAVEPFASYRSEQLRWVRDVLERHETDPSIRAIFVAFHHSPFVTFEARGFLGFGGHPGHSEMVANLRVPGEEFLLDLFRRARVTAVFSRPRALLRAVGRDAVPKRQPVPYGALGPDRAGRRQAERTSGARRREGPAPRRDERGLPFARGALERARARSLVGAPPPVPRGTRRALRVFPSYVLVTVGPRRDPLRYQGRRRRGP